MVVIFEFQESAFASKCNDCVKKINDQCCRNTSGKICCEIEYTARAKAYPNCPTGSSSSRGITAKGFFALC